MKNLNNEKLEPSTEMFTKAEAKCKKEVKREETNITAIPYCYTIGELFRSSYSSSILGITAEA
jgi:hypothetical protein